MPQGLLERFQDIARAGNYLRHPSLHNSESSTAPREHSDSSDTDSFTVSDSRCIFGAGTIDLADDDLVTTPNSDCRSYQLEVKDGFSDVFDAPAVLDVRHGFYQSAAGIPRVRASSAPPRLGAAVSHDLPRKMSCGDSTGDSEVNAYEEQYFPDNVMVQEPDHEPPPLAVDAMIEQVTRYAITQLHEELTARSCELAELAQPSEEIIELRRPACGPTCPELETAGCDLQVWESHFCVPLDLVDFQHMKK